MNDMTMPRRPDLGPRQMRLILADITADLCRMAVSSAAGTPTQSSTVIAIASRIDRLRSLAAIAEDRETMMIAALRPFAAYADMLGRVPGHVEINIEPGASGRALTQGDCYRALEALRPDEVQEGRQ